MANFTEDDIHYGAGAFTQAMRTQTSVPGRAPRMTPGEAIGIIAAAIRAGLSERKLEEVIDRNFAHNATFLKRVRDMYEGCDWSISLWQLLPEGKYRLATALCRPDEKGWRYDPSAADIY